MSDAPFEQPAIELIDVMDEGVNYNRFLVEEIVRAAGSARRVLDFGAGNGRFAAAMTERGYEVCAVEPDARLRETISAKGVSVHEALGDVPDGSVECAYTMNVIEHIEDDVGALREIHRCLAPGGRLLVYVPAFPMLWTSNDTLVGHVRRYERPGLLETLRAAGFAPQDARYVDCLGFLAALAYRAFGSREGDIDPGAMRFYDRFVFPLSAFLDRGLHRFVGKNLMALAAKA